jgi:glutathione S-transferase
MNNSRYTLYYFPLNASFAPHLVLEKLSLDYELALVDRDANAHKSSDYLELNPSGRIPVLTIDQKALFESAAICMHVAETHSYGGLVPEIGSSARPEYLQWMMYLTNTFQAEMMIYFYPTRHVGPNGNPESIIETQKVRINDILEILDKQLFDRQYLLGEHLSVCDYFLLMLCIWADEMPKPPLAFTNLSRYLRNLVKDDAVQKVCAKEGFALFDYR